MSGPLDAPRTKTLSLNPGEIETLIATVSEAFGVRLRAHGEGDAETQRLLGILMRVRELRYVSQS